MVLKIDITFDGILSAAQQANTRDKFFFEDFTRETTCQNLCQKELDVLNKFPANISDNTLCDSRAMILNRYFAYYCELITISADIDFNEFSKMDLYYNTAGDCILDFNNNSNYSDTPPFVPDNVWHRILCNVAWATFCDLPGNILLLINRDCKIAQQIFSKLSSKDFTGMMFETECNYANNGKFVKCFDAFSRNVWR